jgi:hypothetical protein
MVGAVSKARVGCGWLNQPQTASRRQATSLGLAHASLASYQCSKVHQALVLDCGRWVLCVLCVAGDAVCGIYLCWQLLSF